MSKFKSKLARRIMAFVLSGAMVMSSLTTSNISAYAAEPATEETSEVETVQEVNDDGEAEETPEKVENPLEDEKDGEDQSKPGDESQSKSGDEDQSKSNDEDQSKPGDEDQSKPGNDEGSSVADEGSSATDEGSSVATESSDVESSDVESSGDEDAVTKIYTYDATTYTAGDDKEEFDAGTFLTEDKYFKVVGGPLVKRCASGGGAVTSTEVGKAFAGAIQFEITGTATVVIEAASTGGSNTSPISLRDASDEDIDEDTGITEVTGTSRTKLTYTNLTAGTYRVGTSGTARGARVYTIVVTEKIPVVTTEYLYDATTYTAGDDKEEFDAGTFLTEDKYFKVVGGPLVKRCASGGGAVTSTEVGKAFAGAIQFEITGTATVVIEAASTGGSNTSPISLRDASDEDIDEDTGITEVTGTSRTKLTYTNLTAGTYRVGTSGTARGARVYTIKVTEKTSGARAPRADWSTVDKPEITSAELNATNSANIDVSVSALIGYDGGDQLAVTMANEEGEVVDTKTFGDDGDTFKCSFTPKVSGKYTFAAALKRADEEDKLCLETKEIDFILPLTKPSITRATNMGGGKIEIAYDATVEAVKYVASAVEVVQSEDANGKETFTPVEDAKAVTLESETTTVTFTDLTVGKYYAFTVYAYRGEEDVSSTSDPFYKIVTDKAEQIWDFSAYGTSTSKSKNDHDGDPNDGEFRVWATGNGGKITPDSSEDGLSFVYTKVDKNTNFTLQAKAHVNSWTYSNGQEGFGLMMADAVGANGDGVTFWNNTYMAAVTKGNYTWDGATIAYEPASNETGTPEGTRYQMYLGVNSIRRAGVTDAWKAEQAAGANKPSLFVTHEQALDATAGMKGLPAGEYNVIANHTNASKGSDIEPLITDVTLRIQKNNTGYFITYIDANGKETTNKYFDSAIYSKDYANQDLLQIDKENIYVGFIAARNADVTFSDVSFETVSVDDDDPPEEEPISYNTPYYTVLSSSITNSEEYEFQFTSNWQGTLSIKDAAGNELVTEALYKYLAQQPTSYLGDTGYVDTNMLDKFFTYEYVKGENGEDAVDTDSNKTINYDTVKLKAGVKALIPIVADVTDAEGNVTKEGVNQSSLLSVGANTFTFTFTPDRNWHVNDNEKQQLSSYDTSVQTFTVNYRKYGTDESNLYVSPSGKATADGTKEAPLDIYTAVKYVQPGQTIVLMDGTYSLKTPLTIERGIDGTADKPIRMVTQNKVDRSNPWAPSSVVIDFNGVASGMTIAGDYWYFRGFDVTNSSDGNKGIQVSGSHNVLDQINTYANGNTGIQISRYRGTDADKSDDWPAYNTILNCTSFLNVDSGYEDADGFAAKLTIGDGNVFDGCIAAYNADDGWDLYAKAETGAIGQVTIQNSVAFKNGYVLRNNNGDFDIDGTNEIKGKGNGNGLKLGGESLKGHHIVLNSYSFLNKANGIESNSCPDIQVFNSVSLDNEGANIAFYTKSADYTEYRANNVISIRTRSGSKDNLAPAAGTKEGQVQDFDNASAFYWRSDDATVATNKNNAQVTTNDFKDVTFNGLSSVTRNEKGTINMGDFLALKDDAAAKTMFVDLSKTTLTDPVGVSYVTYKAAETGTSGDLSGMPILGGTETDDKDAEVNPDKDTDGTIDSNDDTDSVTSDIWTDEEFAQLDTTGNNTLKILLDLDYDEDGNYYVDYTGAAIKPAVRVAYGTTELTTKNYSVSFKNNVKAYELLPGDEGFNEKLAPTVIIRGKGNYAGQYNLYFTIKKIDMGSNDKVVAADIATASGTAVKKATPALTFDGKKLNAKEYTVSAPYTVENGKKTPYTGTTLSEGTYYFDLTGAEANFTGTKKVTVEALNVSNLTPMSKVKVDKIPDQIYDGTPHRPAVTVKNGRDTLTASVKDDKGNITTAGDYEIVDYYNNTDVGVASVVLAGNIDRGYYGTKTVTFKTLAKSFNVKDYAVTVKYKGQDYTTDAEYKTLAVPSTTSAVTFSNIVVKVIANEGSEPKTLTENVDYTVSYKGNDKAGTASLIIKGMGDFKGKMTRTFKILPLDLTTLSAEQISVTVADQEYAKGGVKPSVVVRIDGKTISPNYYSVSYKNNNKITTSDADKATVSIAGKKLLKGSIKDVATFKVNPKNLSKVTVSAPDVYYGTAKEKGSLINYATKLVVTDSNGKRLSLGSDYTVKYYYDNNGEREELARNGRIPYDGINTTIYAEITKGTKDFYTGTLNTTYNVVGKNDIRAAKVEKIVGTYPYNDTAVAVPTDELIVKIQNKKIVNGKYVKDSEFTTLTLNTDYKIVNIKNNDRAGTATITLQGMGNYCGTNKATYKIVKKELSSWDYYITYAYANNITVIVDEDAVAKYASGITFKNLLEDAAANKIFDASGNALTYDKHFTATDYTNNTIDETSLDTEKTATVVIKGIAPYTGSKTIRFTIKGKNLEPVKPEDPEDPESSSEESSSDESSSDESSSDESSKAEESSSATESSKAEESSSVTESSKAEESSAATESSKAEESSVTTESSENEENSESEENSENEESALENEATGQTARNTSSRMTFLQFFANLFSFR